MIGLKPKPRRSWHDSTCCHSHESGNPGLVPFSWMPVPRFREDKLHGHDRGTNDSVVLSQTGHTKSVSPLTESLKKCLIMKFSMKRVRCINHEKILGEIKGKFAENTACRLGIDEEPTFLIEPP